MKRILICLSVIFALTGCGGNGNNDRKDVTESPEVAGVTVREYVDGDSLIDVDINSMARSIVAGNGTSDSETNKAKAAIYRFYKHVAVVDSIYVCSVSTGSEINLSESTFQALMKNLDDMNAAIKAARASGEEIEISVPDEAYLNSLLE